MSRRTRLTSRRIDITFSDDFCPLTSCRPDDHVGGGRGGPAARSRCRSECPGSVPCDARRTARAIRPPHHHPARPHAPTGRALTSSRVAALPILDRFLQRLRIERVPPRPSPAPRTAGRASPPPPPCSPAPEPPRLARAPLRRRRVGRAVTTLLVARTPESNSPRSTTTASAAALDRLFDADIPSLSLDVAAHAVREFDVASRRIAQRFHHRDLPRRLRGRRPRAHATGTAPARHHLGPQQGPPPRPQATALHPHRHRRRRRAGAVPGRERQRHRRPLAPRDLGLALQADRPRATSSTSPTASSPPPRTWPTSTRTAAGS